MIHSIQSKVKECHPLIHCITNPISIHQCANAILAVGARPMMAEHPKEVREITQSADALLLNLGNITDARMESMLISAKAAKQKGIPVVLDAVGVACSTLRRRFARELLKTVSPTVIKGNYSEINALYHEEYHSAGVDADASLEQAFVSRTAIALAGNYRAVILASGEADIITDGKRLVYGYNGTPQLATVTGTGCMLGALCAAYLSGAVKADTMRQSQIGITSTMDAGRNSATKNVVAMDAVITACTVLGICGKLSETGQGSGSFMTNLMNILSILKDADIEKYLAMEEKTIEGL